MGVELRVEVVDLGAQELVASGQAAQGSQGGGVGQVVDLVRASGGKQVNELVTAQITVLVTQPGAGVDQDGADLAPAGLEGFVGASAGHHQSAQRFDRVALGVGGGLAGDHGAGGAVGVETVGLALFAALRGPGAVDLDHLDAVAAQGRGDPDAVAGGALDADRGDRSVLG